MALLEMIGLGGDKQAVIFDFGNAYTKIGFAGEPNPRHIIPSTIERLVGNRLIKINVWQHDVSDLELYETIREFLHMIYFKCLLVNPKERKVVLSESILMPNKFRRTLAKVLFTHFDVISILFAPSHLFALFTVGVPSALVVDCGYSETLIVPIYEHIPILAAIESFQVAGKVLHAHLHDELLQSTAKDIEESFIENIKVTTCFVGRHKAPVDHIPKSVDCPIGNGSKVSIDGKLRAHIFDLLFDGDEEGKSIATYILDAISRCPIDCRKVLSENILLIGGSTMTPGFEARVLSEVRELLANGSYSKKLAFKTVKLRRPPVQANYVSWLGAAICGVLETLSEYSISREKYKENQTLPDWASLSQTSSTSPDKQVVEGRAKLSSYRKSISQAVK